MAKSKKIISIICCLALVLCFVVGLVACNKKTPEPTNDKNFDYFESLTPERKAAVEKALMADSYQNYAETCVLNTTKYPEISGMGLKLVTGYGSDETNKSGNAWNVVHDVDATKAENLVGKFDPTKPTIILIHGVQFNEGRYLHVTLQSDCRPSEIANNIDPNPAEYYTTYFKDDNGYYEEVIDLTKYYRDLGYNALYFHYEGFADPIHSDEFSQSLNAVSQVTDAIWCNDYCVATYTEAGTGIVKETAVEDTFTNGKFCVAEFYVAEYLRWINAVKEAFPNVDYATTNPGITTAAHSMGGVVNVASNFLLSQVAEAGYMSLKLLPERMMQMDPYVGSTDNKKIAWTGEKYLSGVECDTYATALEILVYKYNIGTVYFCNNGFAVPCMMVFALWDPERQVFTNSQDEIETDYDSFSHSINRILNVCPFVVLQAYYPPSENDEIPGIAGTCCHNAIREWVLATILYDAPTTKDANGNTFIVPTMKMSAKDIISAKGHFFYQIRYTYDEQGNIVYDEDDGYPVENLEFTETIRCDDDTFILQK